MPTEANGVDLELRRAWAAVEAVEAAGAGAAALSGAIRPDAPAKAKLEAKRRADAAARRVPLEPAGAGRFTTRVSLDELGKAGAPPDDEIRPDRDEGVVWELAAALGGGRRVPVLVPDAVAGAVARRDGTELALTRTRQGDAALVERTPRAVVESATWSAEGALALAGTLPVEGAAQFVLRLRDGVEEHAVAVRGEAGRFAVTLTPAAVASMAGTLPLREGTWRLFLRAAGAADAPVMVAPALVAGGPLLHTVDHKGFMFSPTGQDGAAVLVERDLDDDERGPYHQRRLRAATAAARGAAGLRDAVVYLSFGGRQYSDNPRAIHEELARRELPLEHLWVVRDGACAVPGSARVVRKSSREYHEALATCALRRHQRPDARLVHARRRPGGGADAARPPRAAAGLRHRGAARQGAAAAQGARRAGGELVVPALAGRAVLGVPARRVRRGGGAARDGPAADRPAGGRGPGGAAGGRARRARAAREREGRALRADLPRRRGRPPRPLPARPARGPGRLRDAAGPDAVVLFRKHPFISDTSPQTGERILDVSTHPDGTELLLAADVLVTDYSSLLVDFAPTGLPLLCFGYDLEEYEAAVRGFYVPFEETVPAPLLRTEDELAAALADPEAACAPFAGRREEFVAAFCPLDDGGASARVADRVFS